MRREHGFSLLEMVVVIAIISLLVVVALNRLLPFIDEAERVSVLRIEGQLRSTLMMEAATRIVRGQSATIADLESSNPVNFLAEPPKHYLGVLQDTELDEAPLRHWYFDAARRRLVYRLGPPYSGPDDFAPRENPAFGVRVSFADADGNGRFEAARDELHGVHLVRLAGVDWLDGVPSY